MPARKPQGLKTRHDTAEEKAARIADEQAMTPKRELPAGPPAQLKGHKVAGAAWRRMIKVYNELDAKIVTAMDMDVLLDVCIGVEQLAEMDAMRASAKETWKALQAMISRVKDDVLEELALYDRIDKAYDKITKLDARCDQKRKLLLSLRQSLYLTPRARAATAPSKKAKEEATDPFEDLLDSANEFIRTGAGK